MLAPAAPSRLPTGWRTARHAGRAAALFEREPVRYVQRVSEGEPTVFVVDDDASVRRFTERLLRSSGFRVQTFASAKELTQHARVDGPACLVLDVYLPDLSGLDLPRQLAGRACRSRSSSSPDGAASP